MLRTWLGGRSFLRLGVRGRGGFLRLGVRGRGGGGISQAGSQMEGEISQVGCQREGGISQVGCQREVSRAGSQREELSQSPVRKKKIQYIYAIVNKTHCKQNYCIV